MAKSNIYYIYILINKTTQHVVYVGCTINVQSRTATYFRRPACYETPIWHYVYRNKKSIQVDIIESIKTTKKNVALKLEKYWIDQFRQWGFPLLNMKDNLSYKHNHNHYTINADHPINILRNKSKKVVSHKLNK